MPLHCLDSSAWIECLDQGPNTQHFAPILKQLPDLLVPSVVIVEVRKVILRQRSRSEADQVTDSMQSCQVIDLSPVLAALAADWSVEHKLSLADAIIYASISKINSTLWTQDQHFEGLPNVRYFPKIKTKKLQG